MIAIMQPTDGKDIRQILQNRDALKRDGAPALPRIAAWLPFIMACVLEIVWLMAPGTALGFFSLLGFIFMIGLSLIVGIVLLIKGENCLHTIGILLGTIILLPFLTWILLDILKLHLR